MPPFIAVDTETHRIKEKNIAPKIVCFTVAYKKGKSIYAFLKSNAEQDFSSTIDEIFDVDAEHHIGFANAAFDLGVFACSYPSLIPNIFKMLEQGRIHDIIIRQKLMDLSTHGHMKSYTTSEGVVINMSYALSSLEKRYLGVSRSAEKEDQDSWRLNYHELDGIHSEEWPEEAIKYAKEDAINTLRILYHQEEQAIKQPGENSIRTETFQVGVDFCLFLATIKGMAIDEEARDQIKEQIEKDTEPLNQALIDIGILRPEEPPRAYKNNPGKFTKGKKESVDTSVLADLIVSTCKKNDLPLSYTPTGRIAASEEVLEDLVEHNNHIDAYVERQKTRKIITTEIPRMDSYIIHFPFWILKETGRTSSSASKLYPSANGQNIDPRVRQCYQARPGMVLCSVDYSYLELCTLAQTVWKLFDFSILKEIICAGVDPHAFLGAQLAYALDTNFNIVCSGRKATRADEIYEAFILCKDTANQQPIQDFFKKYRTFAKPTGLGYPGGLGPKTFIKFAKGNYGIRIDLDTATRLREVWFDTFPEMRDYFDWIQSSCTDPNHHDKFAYVSPLGMYRANCAFTSACNGKALQTPAAEGAKLAIWNVQRACFDPEEKSLLYGCYLVNFLHDELIVEMPDDKRVERRANEISRLMVVSMEEICKDVPIKAEPTLMYRWDKFVEPTFNEAGNLIPSNTREFIYDGSR